MRTEENLLSRRVEAAHTNEHPLRTPLPDEQARMSEKPALCIGISDKWQGLMGNKLCNSHKGDRKESFGAAHRIAHEVVELLQALGCGCYS